MKFDRIYIEKDAADHSRTQAILDKAPLAERVSCERFGEVFNPNHQNFRLQKQNPNLILAHKTGQRVLPTPPGYGIGADYHYYFSHMLNCLYDCRYCFLQGMYRSANYVHFTNYEDFQDDIDQVLNKHPDKNVFFFSGYDCDSLAMERLTGFTDAFFPFFKKRDKAWLELRTKSVNISPLLKAEPIPNIVTAFSLNPSIISRKVEHRTPPTEARLKAIKKLVDKGWKVGFRFDPLILFKGWKSEYEKLIDETFALVPESLIHSVTFGTFRSPKQIFKSMESLYPEEPLFMGNMELSEGEVGYADTVDQEMRSTVRAHIQKHCSDHKIFECA